MYQEGNHPLLPVYVQDCKIKAFMIMIESFFNNRKSNIYLCGDFNINLLNYYYYHNAKYILDSIFMQNLYPCINRPT